MLKRKKRKKERERKKLLRSRLLSYNSQDYVYRMCQKKLHHCIVSHIGLSSDAGWWDVLRQMQM